MEKTLKINISAILKKLIIFSLLIIIVNLSAQSDVFYQFSEEAESIEKYLKIENDIKSIFSKDTSSMNTIDNTESFNKFRNTHISTRNKLRNTLLNSFQEASYNYFSTISNLQDLINEKDSYENSNNVIKEQIKSLKIKEKTIERLMINGKHTYNEKVSNLPIYCIFASKMKIDADSTAISQNVELLLQTTKKTEELTPSRVSQFQYMKDDELLRKWSIQSGAKVKLYDQYPSTIHIQNSILSYYVLEIYPIPFNRDNPEIAGIQTAPNENESLSYHQFPFYIKDYNINIDEISFKELEDLVGKNKIEEILTYKKNYINNIVSCLLEKYNSDLKQSYKNQDKKLLTSFVESKLNYELDKNQSWISYIKKDLRALNDSLTMVGSKTLLSDLFDNLPSNLSFPKCNETKADNEITSMKKIIETSYIEKKIKEELALAQVLYEPEEVNIISFIRNNMKKINDLNLSFEEQIEDNQNDFNTNYHNWETEKQNINLKIQELEETLDTNCNKISTLVRDIANTSKRLDEENQLRISKQEKLNTFNTDYYEYYNFIHTQTHSGNDSMNNFLNSFSNSFRQFVHRFASSITYEKMVYQDSLNSDAIFENSTIKTIIPNLIGYKIISTSVDKENNVYKMNIAFKFHFTETENIEADIETERLKYGIEKHKITLINKTRNTTINRWKFSKESLINIPQVFMDSSNNYSYPDLNQLQSFFRLVKNDVSIKNTIDTKHIFYVKELYSQGKGIKWDGKFITKVDLPKMTSTVNLLLINKE